MFEMDLKTAMLFYRICRMRKAETEKQKVEVMLYLAEKKRLKSVMHTNRTPDQVAKDLAKNFGKVLYIKKKGDDDANNGHQRRG